MRVWEDRGGRSRRRRSGTCPSQQLGKVWFAPARQSQGRGGRGRRVKVGANCSARWKAVRPGKAEDGTRAESGEQQMVKSSPALVGGEGKLTVLHMLRCLGGGGGDGCGDSRRGGKAGGPSEDGKSKEGGRRRGGEVREYTQVSTPVQPE